jgi:hypothetical protein
MVILIIIFFDNKNFINTSKNIKNLIMETFVLVYYQIKNMKMIYLLIIIIYIYLDYLFIVLIFDINHKLRY